MVPKIPLLTAGSGHWFDDQRCVKPVFFQVVAGADPIDHGVPGLVPLRQGALGRICPTIEGVTCFGSWSGLATW